MTDTPPLTPALRHLDMQVAMFEMLSDFQQSTASMAPVVPTLRAVLAAALPAFEQGFAYTASHWSGELQVTLHFGGAELGSSAPAAVDSYSDTCARLLAGLLGIPLLEGDQPVEPEPLPLQQQTACHASAPEPPPADPDPGAPEPADEFEELLDNEPAPSDDIHRSLSEQETETAIAMVKAMTPDRRRAFSKAFREVFQVPSEAKQIVPYFVQLQHLHFIDRYTVEASGGIAA